MDCFDIFYDRLQPFMIPFTTIIDTTVDTTVDTIIDTVTTTIDRNDKNSKPNRVYCRVLQKIDPFPTDFH